MSKVLSVFNTRNGKYGTAQQVNEETFTVIIDGKQKEISAKTFKNWYKEVSAEDVKGKATPTPEQTTIELEKTEQEIKDAYDQITEKSPEETIEKMSDIVDQLTPAPEKTKSTKKSSKKIEKDNVVPFPTPEVTPAPEAEKTEVTPAPEEVKLTAFEIKLLNAMRSNEYNDAIEHPTWVFTAIDNSGIEGKKARGVISSLIKKDLVWVEEGDKKKGDEDAIGFTDKGIKLFDNADGEDCSWGGKKLLKELEITESSKGKKKEKVTPAPTPEVTPAPPKAKKEGNAKQRNKIFFTKFMEALNEKSPGFSKANAREKNYMSFPAGASGIKYKWFFTGDKLECSLYFFGGSELVTTSLFKALESHKETITNELDMFDLEWKSEEGQIHRRVSVTFTGGEDHLINRGVEALIRFKEVFTPILEKILA